MTDTSESQNDPEEGTRHSMLHGMGAILPKEGRLLGLDYGTKRLGVAVCDDLQIIASPLENYSRYSIEADELFLKQTVKEYRIIGIVVGLPVHMSGDEGGKATEAREFGQWVAQVTGCPVAFRDERYTTSMANDHLRDAGIRGGRRKELRDKIAAQIILQSYIDSNDRTISPAPYYR